MDVSELLSLIPDSPMARLDSRFISGSGHGGDLYPLASNIPFELRFRSGYKTGGWPCSITFVNLWSLAASVQSHGKDDHCSTVVHLQGQKSHSACLGSISKRTLWMVQIHSVPICHDEKLFEVLYLT